MIKNLLELPNKITIAFSGGVDSVAVTDFLSKSKREISCAFFHHGTEECENAFKFVTNFCQERSLPLFVGMISEQRPKDTSLEEYWRNERYAFLESLNLPIVTAHNLDDCVETYLFGAMHGTPKVIPFKRNNVLRPFLTTKKSELIRWCEKNNLSWYEDKSNRETKHMRNYIRHELIPHALHVNPGLHTMVRKIVEKKLIAEKLSGNI